MSLTVAGWVLIDISGGGCGRGSPGRGGRIALKGGGCPTGTPPGGIGATPGGMTAPLATTGAAMTGGTGPRTPFTL